MSLDNYTDLQASALNWLARSSDTNLAAVVTDAIYLFETEVVTRFRTMDMEITTTFTLAATVPIPNNLIEVRFMNLTGAYTKPINYVTPQVLAQNYGTGYTWGDEPVYSIDAGNFLFPPADPEDTIVDSSENTVALSYYGFTPLSTENPTNWLLTKYPKAYLYGTLAELCAFSEDLRQDGRADWFATMRDATITKIVSSDNRAVHPGVLAMRPGFSTP